jgi:hypothetical protein
VVRWGREEAGGRWKETEWEGLVGVAGSEEEERRMDLGDLPRGGGEAGEVPGGRWAGLRRWTETESVLLPI